MLNKIKRDTKEKNKFIENIALLYVVHIARYIYPVILMPFFARVFGPEKWGCIIFIQSYAIYLALLVEFGFGLSGTKEISKSRDSILNLSNIFCSVFSIQLIIAFLILVISILIKPFVPIFNDNSQLYYFGLGVGITQGLNLNWFFRGIEQMRIVALLDFLAKTLALLMILIFVRNSNNDWIVLNSYLVANVFSIIISFYFYLKKYRVMKPTSTKIITMFKSSFVLFWVRAGASLLNEGNVFIIGFFSTPIMISYFGCATRVISSLRSLFIPIIDALFPKMSFTLTKSYEEGEELLRKVFYLLMPMGLLMSIFTFIFAETIVNILFGKEFLFVAELLKYFSPLLTVIALSHILGSQWMVPLDFDVSFSRIIILGGVLSILNTLIVLLLELHVFHIVVSIVLINVLMVFLFVVILKKHDRLPRLISIKKVKI